VTQSSRSIRRYIPPLLFDAPDFRRLWFGQTISVFGDQITQLGLPLVAVLTLGADATQMGTLTPSALRTCCSLGGGCGWIVPEAAVDDRGDLGRAALIASIPVAYALVLRCPAHVIGLADAAVVFDPS
jgi:hypothetical protein